MFASGRFCYSFASSCVLSLAMTRLVTATTEPGDTPQNQNVVGALGTTQAASNTPETTVTPEARAPLPAQPSRFTSPSFAPPSAANGNPAQTTLYWPKSFFHEEARDARPKYLNYDPSQPIPSGYKLQTYIPRGYIIGGSITFGVAYGLGLISATTSQDKDFQAHWLLLPVLGPFIGMTTQHETCARGTVPLHCGRDPDTLVVLAILGGMQTVGAGLFVYGVTHPRQRLLRIDYPNFVLAPAAVGLGGYGLAAAGMF